MENPIKMDDLGVPLFLETHTWWIWIHSSFSQGFLSIKNFSSLISIQKKTNIPRGLVKAKLSKWTASWMAIPTGPRFLNSHGIFLIDRSMNPWFYGINVGKYCHFHGFRHGIFYSYKSHTQSKTPTNHTKGDSNFCVHSLMSLDYGPLWHSWPFQFIREVSWQPISCLKADFLQLIREVSCQLLKSWLSNLLCSSNLQSVQSSIRWWHGLPLHRTCNGLRQELSTFGNSENHTSVGI